MQFEVVKLELAFVHLLVVQVHIVLVLDVMLNVPDTTKKGKLVRLLPGMDSFFLPDVLFIEKTFLVMLLVSLLLVPEVGRHYRPQTGAEEAKHGTGENHDDSRRARDAVCRLLQHVSHRLAIEPQKHRSSALIIAARTVISQLTSQPLI